MRVGHVVGVLALLAGPPALAQVVVTTPGTAPGYHEYRAQQSREAAHEDMRAARENAAMGNYAEAARDQEAARHNWREAHHQEHRAERDSTGRVIVLGQ